MKTSYTRGVCIVCILAVLLSGCSSPSSGEKKASAPALLTTISQQRASPVPSSFIGMNIELVDLCSILRTDAAHQQSYEQLFKNLGNGTLHVAGHSADEGIWEPNARLACLAHTIVTKTLVQSFFAFARRIDWKVIWGLNFLIDNPQMAASEAAYVTEVGGNTLLGFSIGNEPELFAKHGERPAQWGLSNYLAEWEADRNAVLAQVPTAKFFGPEACCQTALFASFVYHEGNNETLVAASRHYYYYNGTNTLAKKLTAEALLSPQAMESYTLAVREWVSVAAQARLPIDITEINSISNGGILGISNSFAATLWTSNILFQSALFGVNQMDFQEVPGAAYALINTQRVPQPVYYGLLFFHLATMQASLLPSVLNTSENVSAYVMEGADATLRVVVINKEPQRGIEIAISPGSSYHMLATIRMQAASLAATSGVMFGNGHLAADGTWSMPPSVREPIQAKQTVLSVPASSAALFTFSK